MIIRPYIRDEYPPATWTQILALDNDVYSKDPMFDEEIESGLLVPRLSSLKNCLSPNLNRESFLRQPGTNLT